MQQFTVPQFIDVEDKILGPMSVRQFLILLAGGMFGFIFYKIADFSLFVLLGVLDLAFTGIFAFFKVNGVPFHFFLLNVFQTFKRPSLRVWYHEETRVKERMSASQKMTETIITKKPFATASLSQLALIVDTGGVYKGET